MKTRPSVSAPPQRPSKKRRQTIGKVRYQITSSFDADQAYAELLIKIIHRKLSG